MRGKVNRLDSKLVLTLALSFFFAAAVKSQAGAPSAPQGFITYRTYAGDVRNAVRNGAGTPDGLFYPKRAEGPYNGITSETGDDPGDDETRPPGDVRNNYIMELIGYFYPPKTGKIQLAISSDDPGELYLSTDDTPANKKLLAREPEWNGIRAFGAESRRTMVESGDPPIPRLVNQSPWINVEAGKPYFLQAFAAEFGGGDNLAVAFRYEGDPDFADGDMPILGKYLSTIDRADLRATYLSKFTATPDGFAADVHDGTGAGAASLDPASIKVQIDGAPVTAQAAKKAGIVTVTAKAANLFTSGSQHTAKIDGRDTAGTAVSFTQTFSAPVYALVPPALKVTADTSKPGFLWRVHQNNAAGTANNNTRTERQLRGEILVDGNRIPNLADPNVAGGADKAAAAANPDWAPITFEVSNVINFSQAEGENNGRFVPDLQMPGIPGLEGSTDAIAAEIITFLELPAGIITMGVNSDDGFLTTIGTVGELEDAFVPPLVAGEFNGGRGASDTVFTIFVQEAGVYPFRTTWEEGGGGANVEWWTIKADGTRVLVNDTANGGIKAYRAMVPGARKAVGRKIDPKPGQGGITAGRTITVEVADGSTPIDRTTVSLLIDGKPVTANVTKTGNITTVTHTLAGPFGEKETHNVSLRYTEAGSPVVREWTFVTQTNELIAYWDFNDASNPEGTKDVVGGYLGVFMSGAKLTDDGKGRTGRPGDRAARPGSEEPAVNGHIRVEGAHVAPLNTGGKQNQLAVSFWQRLDVIRNSSAFWIIGAGQDRAFQAHVPWGNSTIYFDTGGGCCDGTQRIQQDMTEFAGGDALSFVQKWHHFVFQKNVDKKEIWIDGKLFFEGENNSPLTFQFTRLAIGSDSNGGNNTHGDIDDFAVFASALTPAEIDRLAKGASPSEIRKAATPPPAGAKFTSVKVSGGNIVIEWSGAGSLQSADSITGPWTDVAGAASPFSVAAGTSRAKFYRFKP